MAGELEGYAALLLGMRETLAALERRLGTVDRRPALALIEGGRHV